MLRDESIVPYKHGEWPFRRSRVLRYSIAVLAVLHFFWMRAGKHNFAEVWVYTSVLLVLLVFRLRVLLAPR